MTKENAQINQIKEYLTSTVRAIGGDEDIQIDFNSDCENNFFSWNQNLVDGKVLVLPQISQEILKQNPNRHPECSEGSLDDESDLSWTGFVTPSSLRWGIEMH